jgi:hypothetical protein
MHGSDYKLRASAELSDCILLGFPWVIIQHCVEYSMTSSLKISIPRPTDSSDSSNSSVHTHTTPPHHTTSHHTLLPCLKWTPWQAVFSTYISILLVIREMIMTIYTIYNLLGWWQLPFVHEAGGSRPSGILLCRRRSVGNWRGGDSVLRYTTVSQDRGSPLPVHTRCSRVVGWGWRAHSWFPYGMVYRRQRGRRVQSLGSFDSLGSQITFPVVGIDVRHRLCESESTGRDRKRHFRSFRR